MSLWRELVPAHARSEVQCSTGLLVQRAQVADNPVWRERMFTDDPAELARRLADLKVEHRDLDAAIERIVNEPGRDELQLSRLKKRKLKLKDMIEYLENKLIPDLDA